MVNNFQASTSCSSSAQHFFQRAIKNSELKLNVFAVPFDYYYYSMAYNVVQNEKNTVHIYLVCDETKKMQNCRHPLHFQLFIRTQYVFCFVLRACVEYGFIV